MIMWYTNVAPWDRALRLGAGILLGVLAYGGMDAPHTLVLGARVLLPIPWLTALVGWCPLYAIMRFSTRDQPLPGTRRRGVDPALESEEVP